MRLLAKLTPRSEFAYDNTTNHKLQGRIYSDLQEHGLDEYIHNKDGPRLFTFTLPFPHRGGEPGDERYMMVAAHNDDIITAIADSMHNNPELNIGNMPFTIQEVHTFDTRVSERGVIESSSPVFVKINGERARNTFNIDTEYDEVHWKPEHGTEVFFERIRENLQRKYRLAHGDEPPEPPYFTNYSLDRTVGKPVEFPEHDYQYVLSRWKFEYELDSKQHRELLNLALNTGIGNLNSMGFGMCNIEHGESLSSATQHARTENSDTGTTPARTVSEVEQ